MPGYTASRKKGKKKAKHRPASSPVPCREAQVPEVDMQQDPVCASLLRQAQAAEHESDAECFRLAAERVWSERRSAPTSAFPEEESQEPIVVGVGTFALTPPEFEFGSDKSGEEGSLSSGCSDEESKEDTSSFPSVTVDPKTTEGGEEGSPVPSVHSAPTERFGEEEEDSPPPSIYSAPTEYYGEGEEDVSPPPSGHPNPTVHHGAEEDVSPPPSIYSTPTEYYGEGEEDVSRPPSVCSSPSELGEEGENTSGCSGGTVHTGKEVHRSPSAGSSMDWSRCTTAEEPMSLGQSILEDEEEMETSRGEAPVTPGAREGLCIASSPHLETPRIPASALRSVRTPVAPKKAAKAPRGRPLGARSTGAPGSVTRA